MKIKVNLIIHCFIYCVLLTGLNTANAASTPKHCIVAPKRINACDNLIYTSVEQLDKKKVVCLCKTDKESIISLLAKDHIATQRINIRKLLSKHQISRNELQQILNQIN